MASTYVNDLRLNEMATGDGSGTWGTTTNTNLELIAEAFSYGTEVITTNADTHTTTIADGATDPGRSLYLKYTGTLDSACTITIGPNTVSKVWIIENGTSGSQNIIISQGSGANITIPAGDTKVVYSDGAGAGAAFVDAFASLNVGALNVDGAVNFAADVTFADGADIITASAGTSNFRAGVNAGNSITSGGNYNTVVGDEAGTAITTGDQNVAIGYGALDALTTEHDNVAVGYNALSTETTGYRNVAVGSSAGATQNGGTNNVLVGYNAGTAITTGDLNTFIGSDSGDATTTASSNTAVGSQSLGANTTASYNTAVGASALTANTTGEFNTSVGRNSMIANTEGANNVAVGNRALDANTTANNNTAVGDGALTANTTGAENTAVGTDALKANTTASNNVAVGYYSGQANTTGTQNVSLGAYSFYTNTKSNRNTALGYNTLSSHNLTSDLNGYNTCVGFQAGSDVTTGTQNTFIGGLVGDTTTTASNNTAVGYNSLTTNTTGTNNVAIGSQALSDNSTASNNTALGHLALNATTTGDGGNNALGRSAGQALTTGSDNVFVGQYAGFYAVAQTTGAGNVILGSYARCSTVDGSYANAIGYDVNGAAGYTTIGQSGSDIRAAHGNITWATVSDERYKKDITDSTAGLSFINALRPRTFKYKTLGELPETFNAYEADSTKVFKNSNTNHGFIAQEVKAAIDADDSIKDGFRLWDDREDGSQEVAEAALIPVLVKAIQELSAQVEELKSQIGD
jgi:trimeric autotransporter adhesin